MAAVAALVRGGQHFAQAREPSQRFDLDLSDALPRQAEPAADLLQRLRLVVVEAEAEHEHRARQPVNLPEGGQPHARFAPGWARERVPGRQRVVHVVVIDSDEWPRADVSERLQALPLDRLRP